MTIQTCASNHFDCSGAASIWQPPPGYVGWSPDWALRISEVTAGSGIQGLGSAEDPADHRPVLAAPDLQADPEFLMMWIDDLMRKILKALTCVTQESIGRSQEAQKASLHDECKNIDKEKEKKIEAERKRKRAAVFGVLTRIATTLLIAAIVVAALLSTPVTGPVGVLAVVVGVMTLACALVDLTGACAAVVNDDEAYSLASKLKDAGVDDAELVASAIKLDLGGMVAVGLKEADLPPWAVILVAMTVTIIQAVLMSGGAGKAKDLACKMSAPLRQLAKKFASHLAQVAKSAVDDAAAAAAKQSADDIIGTVAKESADDAAGAVAKKSCGDAACEASESSIDKTLEALKRQFQELFDALAGYLPQLQRIALGVKKIAMPVAAIGSIGAGCDQISAADAQLKADNYTAHGMELRADQERQHKETELAMQFVMGLVKQMYACLEIVKELLDEWARCMQELTRSHGSRTSMA